MKKESRFWLEENNTSSDLNERKQLYSNKGKLLTFYICQSILTFQMKIVQTNHTPLIPCS